MRAPLVRGLSVRLTRVGRRGPQIGPNDRQAAIWPDVVWSHSTVIVHVPSRETCPCCGAPVTVESYTTEPLLRGCGYGAARRVVYRWCSVLCGWRSQPEIDERRPLAAGGVL